MSEKKSLFEVIKENMVNGELTGDFSLPREGADEGELKWADGAMDGVRCYHMGQQDITAEHMQKIADAFAVIADREKAWGLMKESLTFKKLSIECNKLLLLFNDFFIKLGSLCFLLSY